MCLSEPPKGSQSRGDQGLAVPPVRLPCTYESPGGLSRPSDSDPKGLGQGTSSKLPGEADGTEAGR